MSASPDHARRARRLLRSLRTGTVPDPGDDYWASFAARLRHRLNDGEAPQPALPRPPRPAFAWGRLALGLAASLVLAGVLWLAVRPEREAPHDGLVTAESLESLPPDLLDRALDEVVGSDPDETGGAAGLSDEDRRRLLEALRLEVAETSPPQATHSIVPEARLS